MENALVVLAGLAISESGVKERTVDFRKFVEKEFGDYACL
jgi:hypothetical protein